MTKHYISIPINNNSPTLDYDRVWKDIQEAGADRIILGTGFMSVDPEKQQKLLDGIQKGIDFFRHREIEVGVWAWTFLLTGNIPFTLVNGISGNGDMKFLGAKWCCPLDAEFRTYMAKQYQAIAQMKPDLILFDDDYRFGGSGTGIGCFCHHHLEDIARRLDGESLTMNELFSKAFSGSPNRYRNALLASWGDSLLLHAKEMRAAVDEIDPSIRMGICACYPSYDADGADAYDITRIFAGKNKPIMRLIGAPYWTEQWSPKVRLPEIFEFERMQASWRPWKDMELLAEGDVFPRPRYETSAACLELFETALRAAGDINGILKYPFDYTSSADYERGYQQMQLDNRQLRKDCDRFFDDSTPLGLRVYRYPHLLNTMDMSDLPQDTSSFFSFCDRVLPYPHGAYALASNGIPTVYEGLGCGGIVFGENARHLPKTAAQKPLILDLRAAQILTERGWDVGLSKWQGRFTPDQQKFLDGEIIPLLYPTPCSADITLSPKASVLSVFPAKDDAEQSHNSKDLIACYSYSNENKEHYLVFNYDSACSNSSGSVWRNYKFPKLVRQFLTESGSPLPAICHGHPDLYLLCKEHADGRRAIGLWNCSPDYVKHGIIELDKAYQEAEFSGCSGHLSGNTLILDFLPAFAYCGILVSG